MTSQTDQIQTLIASINAILGKSTPRLPWVMSTEVTQQRQLLAQTRDYLASLAKDLEAPGGWGPVDPDSGQITPARRPSRSGEAEAAQVLQALLLEMQYLKENSLKPLRQELTSLKQQRQTLQAEIGTLEAQKLTGANQQQQINQFLEILMERLQDNLSQQLAESVAQVEAGQTSDRLLAETIDGELIADQPQLHPAQRLEQLRLVQAQSDQLLLKLDSTLQTVFESLQKSVESYRESLSEGLDQMHSLGREGEVIFHALVNHIAQQLGQDTSRYLATESEDLEAVLQARELRAELGAGAKPADGADTPAPVDDGVPLLDEDLANLDLDLLSPQADALSSINTEPADASPVDPEPDGPDLDADALDESFDLPLLSDADLAALEDEELTVLQAEPLENLSTGPDEAPNFEVAVDDPSLAATDTILNLLDDQDPVETDPERLGDGTAVTDLSSETFDTLFGESAISPSDGNVDASLDAASDAEIEAGIDSEREAIAGLDLLPDVLGQVSSEATDVIDPVALADAEAWLGLGPEGEDDSDHRENTLDAGGGDRNLEGGEDSGVSGNQAPASGEATLDSLFGPEVGQALAAEEEVDPTQDTVASLAELLPVDEDIPDEGAVLPGEEDYAVAADNEDLLTIADAESGLRPSLDINSSLMEQLEADLQSLAGDEAADPLPGAELEPLNSLLNQDELENLVADLDLAEPLPDAEEPAEADDDATDLFSLPDLAESDQDAAMDETLPSLADLELSTGADSASLADGADRLTESLVLGDDAIGLDGEGGTDLDVLSDLDPGLDLVPEGSAEGSTVDLSGEEVTVDAGGKDGDLAFSADESAETVALDDLTLADLTGFSEPTVSDLEDASLGDIGLSEALGDLADAPSFAEGPEESTDAEMMAAADDLFDGSDWESPEDLVEEVGADTSNAEDATADTLFETIDFGALGSVDGDNDDQPIGFETAAAVAEDGIADTDVVDETGALITNEPVVGDDDLADALDIGPLSAELANELETLSAEANELASQASALDGLQSDLEEEILSDLPAPEVPELAAADPQLETAYLPDPLEADLSDLPPIELDGLDSEPEMVLNFLSEAELGGGEDETAPVQLADLSEIDLEAELSETDLSEPDFTGTDLTETGPSTEDLSALAAALSTVPATVEPETVPVDLPEAVPVDDVELFVEFDDSFPGDTKVETDGEPVSFGDDDADSSSVETADVPVWCLGLDIGTTGLSTVLMDRTTGQVHPFYWLTAESEEKWFRLPMAVWLSTNGEASTEAVGQLAWTAAQQADAKGMLLTGLKPRLKVAVPYQAAENRAQPQIQWSDTTVLPLAQIQQALQRLLQQCLPDEASPLRCETIGLEPAALQQALQNLHAVIVGYPTNWPDTYSFNLREAILAAGLVRRVEQIFFIEDAIATLLSGLPDPDDERAVTTAHQPSLYNCNWQGGTLAISAGATLTEMALVDLPEDLGQLSYGDVGQRSFPYAGDGLDQDIICQLLAAEGARQPLTEESMASAQDWSWRAELPAGAVGQWESLQLESLTLPAAGETALAARHRLQQRLQSSPLGLSVLEAARHLKLILQHQSQFQLDLGSQRWLVRRRDLESRIFLPYIQRINRHLNVLLSQQGISAQAIKQVVCTGGSASLPAIARWLRQKFPNATIIQDTYASDRPQSCSRVAYGLANLARYSQVLDITRHQYSDYFLLMELLRVFPSQPLPVSGIMHLLEQRGINTNACQLHILALLEGHLPPGLVPTASDQPWISPASTAVATYQELTAAPLFTKQSNQIYVPNETQGQRLRAYMEAVVAGKEQSLQEPLIAQLVVPSAV